jgi:hypothetical protein
MSNAPTAEQKLKFAARIYKQTIEPLEKALKRAISCGFPEEHIQRIKHLIEESHAIAALEHAVIPVPKKKPGRPAKGTPTVEDMCNMIFLNICPVFVPLKVQIDKCVDEKGRAKPAPGIKFDFDK